MIWLLCLIPFTYVSIVSVIYNTSLSYKLCSFVGNSSNERRFNSWLWPIILGALVVYSVLLIPWKLPAWIIARAKRPKLPKATLIGLLVLGGCVNRQRECESRGGNWTAYNCHSETRWYGGDCGYSAIYYNGAFPVNEEVCDHRCIFLDTQP